MATFTFESIRPIRISTFHIVVVTRTHRTASPITTRATTFAFTALRSLRISTWTAAFTFELIRAIRISALHNAMLTRIHCAASPITSRATAFAFNTMHRSFNISARSPVLASRTTCWSVVATLSIFVLSEGGGRCRDSDRRSE
ncbi:hypothetical protein [Rosistilla oblonga]|uniref:hypothetical protein n=1 Tax=Rosistilla oblonga TaxID=2527990 RepID=UPI003A97AE01